MASIGKQQLAWFLIRAIGVYFAYCAIVSLVPLGSSIPDLFSVPKIDRSVQSQVPVDPAKPMPRFGQPAPTPEITKEEQELDKAFRIQAFKSFLWSLGASLFYIFAAWYLIRDGRVVFDVLNREQPFGLDDQKEEVTTLNLSEDDEQGEAAEELQ